MSYIPSRSSVSLLRPLLAICTLTLAACAGPSFVLTADNARLVGDWACESESLIGMFTLSHRGVDSMRADGSFSGTGTATLRLANRDADSTDAPIVFAMSTEGRWNSDATHVTLIPTQARFRSTSHPDLNDSIRLEDFVPLNEPVRQEIVMLTPERLVLSDPDGAFDHCTRRP